MPALTGDNLASADGRVTMAKQQATNENAQNASAQLGAVQLVRPPSDCKTVGSAYVGSNPTPATSP
jgi:hypothetical protein